MSTGIGKEWSKVARGWVGDALGRHCHWCSHIEFGDGQAWCNREGAIYGDGERIRTWDGEGAQDCKEFSLNDFYKDDANLEAMGQDEKQ